MGKITKIDDYKFNKENLGLNNLNEHVAMLIEHNLEHITQEVNKSLNDRRGVIRNLASQILALCFINFKTSYEDLINVIAQDGIEEFIQYIYDLISNNEVIKLLISDELYEGDDEETKRPFQDLNFEKLLSLTSKYETLIENETDEGAMSIHKDILNDLKVEIATKAIEYRN